MSRMVSAGIWATAASALGGLWMAGAPFWLGYQDAGGPWTPATSSDVATGLAVFGVGVLGLFGHIMFAVRDAADGEGRGQAAAPGRRAAGD